MHGQPRSPIMMSRIAGIALLCAGCSAPAHEPGVLPSETIEVGKKTREYRLVVPKSVDLAKPAPLVIAFHGMGIDSKDLMPKYTKLDELAKAKEFILVYPGAEGRAWGLVPEKVADDLAFFDALLGKLTKDYRVDADRVYVLG